MKLIIHLFYNTAILHKCPGEVEMYLQTSIDTQMFVKALAQWLKSVKTPKHLLTGE